MCFRNSGVNRSNMKLPFAQAVIWPWWRHSASIVFLPCSFPQASEKSIHSEDAPSWSPCVLPVVHDETAGSQLTAQKSKWASDESAPPVSSVCDHFVSLVLTSFQVTEPPLTFDYICKRPHTITIQLSLFNIYDSRYRMNLKAPMYYCNSY